MGNFSVFILILFFTFALLPLEKGSELEKLTALLKGHNISVTTLEKHFSCYSLDSIIEQGLSEIKNLEEVVKSSRKNTRIAGLFPKITAWSKYKSDEKLYLYQQNNISVGKDYITIGPDDNNTTLGDVNTFEIGGKIEFNLSKLLYNTDTLRFTEQERKLYYFKIEIIEKLTYAYYHSAVLRAIKTLKIKAPANLLLPAQIHSKHMKQWFKSITNMDLEQCVEK